MFQSRLFLIAALALPLPQSTPTGGAIARFVPPVPTPASFISDQRRVLSDSARASLDGRIAAIQTAGLGDIAVAIIPSIGDYSPNQVAVEIYRTWRVGSQAPIGSARRNVGVLLLIVPKELSPNNRGECWINTGTGAEGLITDATAAAICRDAIIPHLRTRDYASALAAGIGGIEQRLRGNTAAAEAPPPERPARSSGSFSQRMAIGIGGAVVLLLGGLFGLAKWNRYRTRKCRQCRRAMRRMDEHADDEKLDAGQLVEEKLKSVDYDVWACDCGHSMALPYFALATRYAKCKTCNRRTALATRKVLVAATTSSTGVAERRWHCKACDAKWVDRITLPVIVPTSSGGGGGRSGGGGGGGGGSSFGGSGSSSGGGGGGSY